MREEKEDAVFVDVTQLITAKEAAELCGISTRWFLKEKGDLRHVPVMGMKGYFREDVIAWNRLRLGNLKRHWKRHAVWQETCKHDSQPCG